MVKGHWWKHFFPTPSDRNNSYYLYVGRVSKEKNLESFLSLELDKKKVVVGDGPSLKSLKKKYPDVEFLGYKFGRELAEIYSNACVKVFPSRTDTFGIVMIEANACGTPVAGYPVTGPIDVVKNGVNGYLNKDLYQAIKQAQKVDPKSCIAYSKKYSWDEVASNFISSVTTAYSWILMLLLLLFQQKIWVRQAYLLSSDPFVLFLKT